MTTSPAGPDDEQQTPPAAEGHPSPPAASAGDPAAASAGAPSPDAQPAPPAGTSQPQPASAGPWASDDLPPHPMSYVQVPEVEQPPSIRTAVRLMWVGAALSLVGVLLTFTQTDAIREAVEESDDSLTQSQIDTAVNIGIGFAVVTGLIGVGLWLWMAHANGRGQSWARIVATVLAGLNVVGTLFNLASGNLPALSLVMALVGIALAVVILVLLYRPDAGRYYEIKSR